MASHTRKGIGYYAPRPGIISLPLETALVQTLQVADEPDGAWGFFF